MVDRRQELRPLWKPRAISRKPARAIPVQGLHNLTAATLFDLYFMVIIQSYCFYVLPALGCQSEEFE
jgi:hypothetical protein